MKEWVHVASGCVAGSRPPTHARHGFRTEMIRDPADDQRLPLIALGCSLYRHDVFSISVWGARRLQQVMKSYRLLSERRADKGLRVDVGWGGILNARRVRTNDALIEDSNGSIRSIESIRPQISSQSQRYDSSSMDTDLPPLHGPPRPSLLY